MNPDMFYQYLPPEEQIKWDQAKKLLEKILKNELPACLAHLIFKSTDDVSFLADESFSDFFSFSVMCSGPKLMDTKKESAMR